MLQGSVQSQTNLPQESCSCFVPTHLAKGVSGCRPLLVENLLQLLNTNILPKIPMQGSCGSSGDLAPLAHLGLMLIGDPLGEATIDGETVDAPYRTNKGDLEPLYWRQKTDWHHHQWCSVVYCDCHSQCSGSESD